MATDTKSTAKSITSLSELIKQQKSAMRDADLSNDINELSAYIEHTTEKIRENTVRKKMSDNMAKRWNNATNPRTYFRAVLPKMFKTWHQNMDLKDQMQDAERKRQELLEEQRQKAISNLKNELKTLIDNDAELSKVFKEYGEKAAMEAALAREENKALRDAEAEFFKSMSTIEERLKNLDHDAQAEWARRKGIQLVKIVDDDPTVEELAKIKNEISQQIENDAQRYDEERKEKVKDIKRRQREREELLQENRWWKKYFNKPKAKTRDGNGSFLDSLLQGGIAGLLSSVIPLLIKAGLIAGIAAAFEKYINDEEFRNKVNDIVKGILGTIWDFMKEHWIAVVAALAIAFPVTTIRLIGKALNFFYESLLILLEQVFKRTGKVPGKGRWGRLAQVGVTGVSAAGAVDVLDKDGNLTIDAQKKDAFKTLEDAEFYKQLTPEELATHKKLVDENKFTEAEAYRDELAKNRGYRPTTSLERMMSGNLVNPAEYTKASRKDIEAIAASVSSVDIPGVTPVEVANFGDEGVKQMAELLIAYKKISDSSNESNDNSGKDKPANEKKNGISPKEVTSARDGKGMDRQLGLDTNLYNDRSFYKDSKSWNIQLSE